MISLFNSRWFVFFLGFLGSAVVWISTSRYGAGVSPDSIQYISTARHLASGEGFVNFAGDPYIYGTPLFPIILAIGATVHLDAYLFARIVNVLAFGISILLSDQILHTLKIKNLRILGLLGVLFSYPVFFVSTMVYSEPVFIVLILAHICCLIRYIETVHSGYFWTLIAVTMLCALQRYVGAIFIISGSITIIFQLRQKWTDRIYNAAKFGIISSIPVLIWVIVLVGGHNLTPADIIKKVATEVAGRDWNALTRWFLPFVVPAVWRVILMSITIILLIVNVIRKEKPTAVKIALTSIAFYLLFFTIIGLYERYLIPLYPLFWLLSIWSLESNEFLSLKKILPFLLAAWLLYPASRTIKNAIDFEQHGAGGGTYFYSTESWMEGELAHYLRSSTVRVYFSNAADFVYWIKNEQTFFSPRRNRESQQIFLERIDSEGAILVWSNRVNRNYLIPLDTLKQIVSAESVLKLGDAEVFRIKK